MSSGHYFWRQWSDTRVGPSHGAKEEGRDQGTRVRFGGLA